MKIRTGFVSNSSSSSFIIDKNKLTTVQYYQIMNVKKVVNDMIKNNEIKEDRFGYINSIDEWEIKEEENRISGFTIMDNFSMIDFIDYVGANKAFIEKYEDYTELKYE